METKTPPPDLMKARRYFDSLSALNLQKKTWFLGTNLLNVPQGFPYTIELMQAEVDILIVEASISGFFCMTLRSAGPAQFADFALYSMAIVSQAPQFINTGGWILPGPLFTLPGDLKNEIVSAYPGAVSGASTGFTIANGTTGIYYNELRKYDDYPMPINKGSKLFWTLMPDTFPAEQPELSVMLRINYMEVY